MPSKKVYSKKLHQWVAEDTERAVDYSDESQFPKASWALLIGFFRLFPDIFLDLLDKGTDGPKQFELEPIQRVLVRANCRDEEVFTTGPRGLTKTFTVMLGSMLTGALYPGTKRAYFAPSMEQAAELASDAFNAVKDRYPVLAEMWHIGSEAKGSFRIYTDYGSEFTVTVRRGSNKHSVIAEECAQSEAGEAFDWDKYAEAVSATVRLKRNINGILDPMMPLYQRIYITSAGTQQNQAFDRRRETFEKMVRGKNAFAIDVPWEAVVLSGIRDFRYYDELRKQNTAEAYLRECCGIWTGTSDSPIIRDSVLTESKNLMVMETRHCGDPDVIYIIGYDVAVVDATGNAKCATAVWKLERMTAAHITNKYHKSLVYVVDEPAPKESLTQAKRLKERWRYFSNENSNYPTYLAIDTNQYGRAVVEHLYTDIGDGLPPLCGMYHQYQEMETKGALPVIYPIRAMGGISGATGDSDMLMIEYAQREWEQGYVSILTSNIYEGVKAYKATHRIKDDTLDGKIATPYLQTRDLCGQIANLKTKPAGYGFRETRISDRIQRDKWSACKYGLHIAELLEKENLMEQQRGASEWAKVFAEQTTSSGPTSATPRLQGRSVGYVGGNRF